MRFRDYFKDRIYSLVILIVLLVPAVLFMRAYRLETPAIVA
ncbi:MAG TPA: sensor histidine kinase, partial [Bacteroides sp.]|nr:sensor histidine kinase [Bacteroides sp.]